MAKSNGNCFVQVVYENGKPVSGVRISGAVANLGGMTRDVITDKNGQAVLSWSQGNASITNIYVNGTDSERGCRNGDTVTFVMDSGFWGGVKLRK